MKHFKHHLISTVIGIVGIGIPAEVANYCTYNVAPSKILVCIIIAALVGYGFGSYDMHQAYKEQNEECVACTEPQEDAAA